MSIEDLLLAFLPIIVIKAALFLERVVPISSSIDPLTFFRFVCQRMALKVHDPQASKQQQTIAGALALGALTIPLLLIIYLIHSIASFPWLIDILLLWVMMQFRQDEQVFNSSLQALKSNKAKLAKDLSQQKLKRDTENLSKMGLIKANLEGTFLRYHYQQFTLICCYLVFGPIAAILYRLSYEAQQQWSSKTQEFAYFGLIPSTISRLIQLIPNVLTSLSFGMASQAKQAMRQIIDKGWWHLVFANFTFSNTRDILLMGLSRALEVNTGGPVMINAKKQNRTRFYSSNKTEPDFVHGNILKVSINKHLILTLSLLIVFYSMALISKY